MEGFRDVLLTVWQEACRHIDIGESTKTIAVLLSKCLPLETLLVRRFDLQHACLDTVALGWVAWWTVACYAADSLQRRGDGEACRMDPQRACFASQPTR